MKERPILFSGAMVKAILEGRKTQTRRVVQYRHNGPRGDRKLHPPPDYVTTWHPNNGVGPEWHAEGPSPNGGTRGSGWTTCPYGVPGDRLWVRESFQPLLADGVKLSDANWKTGEGYAPRYVATDGRTEWMDLTTDSITDRCKPGIHMPRWASRITLEITDVRVQRVQEISEEDCIAEGIERIECDDPNFGWNRFSRKVEGGWHNFVTAQEAFRDLWDSINAARGHGWDPNPWTWSLTLKRIEYPLVTPCYFTRLVHLGNYQRLWK